MLKKIVFLYLNFVFEIFKYYLIALCILMNVVLSVYGIRNIHMLVLIKKSCTGSKSRLAFPVDYIVCRFTEFENLSIPRVQTIVVESIKCIRLKTIYYIYTHHKDFENKEKLNQ